MCSWAPNTWHEHHFRGKAVYPNIDTFEEREKEQEKQYSKSIARLKLRNKLDKEILDEQLNCHLFELEQRRELDKITTQKKKDEYCQEKEHEKLLGKKSYDSYIEKLEKLKNRWLQGGVSEEEDRQLINLKEEAEEKYKRMGEFNGWE